MDEQYKKYYTKIPKVFEYLKNRINDLTKHCLKNILLPNTADFISISIIRKFFLFQALKVMTQKST